MENKNKEKKSVSRKTFFNSLFLSLGVGFFAGGATQHLRSDDEESDEGLPSDPEEAVEMTGDLLPGYRFALGEKLSIEKLEGLIGNASLRPEVIANRRALDQPNGNEELLINKNGQLYRTRVQTVVERSPVRGRRLDDRVADLQVADIGALRDIPPPLPNSTPLNLLGYHLPGDGGGGVFFWDSSSLDEDDDGTVLKPDAVPSAAPGRFRRVFSERVNVRWFGAKGDNVSDDAAAFRKGFEVLRKQGGGVLYIPAGAYKINSGIVVEGLSDVTIRGEGSASTLHAEDVDGFALQLKGEIVPDFSRVSTTVDEGSTQIRFERTEGLAAGDIIQLESTEVFNDDRVQPWRKKEIGIVRWLNESAGTVNLADPTYYSYSTSGFVVRAHRIVPIRNICFDSFRVVMGRQQRQNAVGIQFFENAEARNVEVEDSLRGIWFSTGFRGRISGCRASRINVFPGYALYFSDVQGGEILNSYGVYNRHSIEVAGASKDVGVFQNVVSGDTAAGISTHGGVDRVSFSGNHVTGCYEGIYTRGRSASINNNYLRNITTLGINVGEWGGELQSPQAGANLIISGNNFERTGRAGIRIYVPLEGASIENNIFKDCSYAVDDACIRIANGAYDTTVSHNFISGGAGGIYFDSNNQYRVENVIVSENTLTGLENTAFSNNRGPGGVHCNGMRISGNQISRCGTAIRCSNNREYQNLLIDGNVYRDIATIYDIPYGCVLSGDSRKKNNRGEGPANSPTERIMETDARGHVEVDILRTVTPPAVVAIAEGNHSVSVQGYSTGGGSYNRVILRVADPSGNAARRGIKVNVLVR
ncbi:MAG: right-handed parallel beta-helix repeat-containing protein [Opitutales bacterium]